MSTGYLGTATTPDSRIDVERHEHAAEMRRMWLWYYGYSAMMAIMIAVIVYLAASLE